MLSRLTNLKSSILRRKKNASGSKLLYATRQYLAWRIACLLARLVFIEPLAAWLAASAMFHLNRTAGSLTRSNNRKDIIYDLKNNLVCALYQRGYSRSVRIDRQELTCWDCGGDGCWECNETGIYRTIELYRFEFRILRRRFLWHQPSRLVTWPVEITVGDSREYDRKVVDRKAMTNFWSAALCGLVYVYLARFTNYDGLKLPGLRDVWATDYPVLMRRLRLSHFEPQSWRDWVLIPWWLLRYGFAWCWYRAWGPYVRLKIWYHWTLRARLGLQTRPTVITGYQYPEPVMCERCLWAGPRRWAVHTYASASEDEGEPVDECPRCGNEI